MLLTKTDIVGDSLNECAYKLIEEVDKRGTHIYSRNGECKSLFNVDIWLMNPCDRLLNLKGRKNSIESVFAELFWILSGSNQIEPFINYFLKRAPDYSDDGLTWRGGYGKRLWANNQFQSVLAHFKDDKYTRRAIQTIYDSSMDNYLTYKAESPKMLDVPCNNWIQYYIVPKSDCCDQDRFCMKVVQRSGDVIWGITNVNMFVFSVIHEIMYNFVRRMYPDVQLGEYCHSVTNAHIYNGNEIVNRQVKEILNHPRPNKTYLQTKINLDEIGIPSPSQLKGFMRRLVEMFSLAMTINSEGIYDAVREHFKTYKFNTLDPLQEYAETIALKIEQQGTFHARQIWTNAKQKLGYGVKEPEVEQSPEEESEPFSMAIHSDFFTEEQFRNLLETQHKLNEKFVNEYLKNISIEQYTYALINEISEFLESTPRFKNHKFWKPYLEDDVQNSKIEIIDILHFGLSIILRANRGTLCSDQIKEIVEHQFESYADTRNFVFIYSQMLIAANNSSSVKFAFQFKEFLNILLGYFNMTFTELYDGYFKKVQLNEKRIEEGYMRGEYEKIKDGVEDNRNIEL